MGEESDHTTSYYAASTAPQPVYPRLAASCRAEVCIVGGGFTGLSTALHLAQRGVDVVLLEARRVGWGASGRNGGQLIGGMTEPEKFARCAGPEGVAHVESLGAACNDLVRGIVRTYAIECDLKRGYFDAALNTSEMRRLRKRFQQEAAGGDLRLIERDQVRVVVGSDRYLGGLLDQRNGHLHPLKLALGEARAAGKLGVRIFERSPALTLDDGAPVCVTSSGGVVRADAVVLAGNAYLRGLVPALDGRVIPAGSYVVATAPLSLELAQVLLPLDSAVCDQRTALDYFRLSADRRLLFGGLCNYSGRVPQDIGAILRPKMLRVFPQLRDTAIDYAWGGQIGISINRVPQIGRLGSRIYYAMGYSGHGLAPAHMAGKIVADAFAGDESTMELFERIRHWRIPGGPVLENGLLALGMLWFRLRDML